VRLYRNRILVSFPHRALHFRVDEAFIISLFRTAEEVLDGAEDARLLLSRTLAPLVRGHALQGCAHTHEARRSNRVEKEGGS